MGVSPDETNGYEVRSLSRAVAVLRSVGAEDRRTLADVARDVGLPRPTVFRLLRALASEGLLQRNHDQSYSVGGEVVHLARIPLSRGLPEIARPHMAALHAALDYSVNLAVFDNA